jgi:glycosyltransferase involved in cell wall biosynthesis
MISVALCTYNGERYIREQLESILNQTMPVDEIVVCDDGSTDNTLKIIESFRKDTQTDIRIYRNVKNLGPALNFQKAINLCLGDIVFLSDQDDIWYKNKVQVMVDWFKDHPTRCVAFSDADLIDDTNNLITEKSLWECVGFSDKAIKAFHAGLGVELFCYENRATGATMAVRRDYATVSHFTSICNTIILHDGAIAMLAAEENVIGFIPEKLTRYRCHLGQSVGIGATLYHSLSDDPRETSPLCEQWHSMPLPSPLNERITFIRTRHRHKHQPLGPFRIIYSTGTYCNFYHSRWLSFLLYDLLQWCAVMRQRIFK